MDPEHIAAIVADPRLTPDAVRLILYVALRGDGEHEIESETLRILLRCSGQGPVRTAVKRASHAGYLSWRQGGRSHANRYRYLAPEAELCTHTAASNARYASPVEEEGGEDSPLKPRRLAPEAKEAIEALADQLNGCEGALQDYLGARVDPDRQCPYVRTVASWLADPDTHFRLRNGEVVPPPKRTKVLAEAIHELHATDERERKYKTGDPANLKTKLRVVLDQRGQSIPAPPGLPGPPQSRRGSRRRPMDEQTYTPQEFTGFKK